MTVTTTTRRNDYIGNGATVSFPYTFRILAATDITVALRVDGEDLELAYPADFTVTGVGRPTGGNVDLTVAPADGVAVTVLRRLAISQPTNLTVTGDGFLPETIEEALDRGAMISLQLEELLGRAITVPETELGDPATTTLPAVADRANKYLGFDSDGAPIALSPPSGGGGGGGGFGGTVTPFAETILDDTSAIGMRTTLSVPSNAEVASAIGLETTARGAAITSVNAAWLAADNAVRAAFAAADTTINAAWAAADTAVTTTAAATALTLSKKWGVIPVATAAARDALFPTPGVTLNYPQLVYREDTRRIQAWTGTSWQDLADTVGTGSGGGGGGALTELGVYEPASPPDDAIDESITLSDNLFDNAGFTLFDEFVVNDAQVGSAGNNARLVMIGNGSTPMYGFMSHDPVDLDASLWVWVKDSPFGRSDFPWDVPFPVYGVDFGIGDTIRANAQFDKTGPVTLEVSINGNTPSVHIRDYGSALPEPNTLALHINSILGSTQNTNGQNAVLVTDGLNDLVDSVNHLGLTIGSGAGDSITADDLADAIDLSETGMQAYADAGDDNVIDLFLTGDIATLAAADAGAEQLALAYGHKVVADDPARTALFPTPVAWESRVYNRAAQAGQIYDGSSWITEYTNSGSSEPIRTKVDIRKYGAQAGNGFDNYAAITAAYAATPDNGTLYIPTGQWECHRTLQFNRSVNIEGDGPASALWGRMINTDVKFGVVFGTPFGMGVSGLNWDERGVKTSGCSFRNFSIQAGSDLAPLYAAFISHCHRCTFDNIHIYGSQYNAVMVMGCLQSRFRLIGNLNGPPNTYQERVILKGTVGSVPSGRGIIVGTTTVGPNPMIANTPQYYRRILRTQATPVANDTFLTVTTRDIRTSDGVSNGATYINTATHLQALNTWVAYGVAAPAAGSRFAVLEDGSFGWKGAFMLIKYPRIAPKGFTSGEWGYQTWQDANVGKSPMPTNACHFDVNAEGGTVTGGIWSEPQPQSGGNNKFTGTLQGFPARTQPAPLGVSTLPGELGNGYGLYIEDSIGFHIVDLHVENTKQGSWIKRTANTSPVADQNMRRFSIDNSLFAPNTGSTTGETLVVTTPNMATSGAPKYRISNTEIGVHTRDGGHTASDYTEEGCIIGVRN